MIYILQNLKTSCSILEKGGAYAITEIRKSFIKEMAFHLGLKDDKNLMDKIQAMGLS